MKTILYVCVHNAGRSQMAEAITNHITATKGVPLKGLSAGTIAGDTINPVATQVMEEIGISMDGQHPKQLTQSMADSSDRVITMGCGVDDAACPARILISEDWGLDDPKGQPIEVVRSIRDQIKLKVEMLFDEMSL